MKLGISLSTYASSFGPIVFKGGALADNLAAIRQLGYSGVDLYIDRQGAGEIEQIKRLFQQSGLEVTMYIAIFMAEMGLNLSCPDPVRLSEYLELYKTQIDAAQRLGAPRMPVGNIRGSLEAQDTPATHQERLASSLHELCSYAAERGVKLCLEPTNRYECNSLNRVDACLDFIAAQRLDRLGLLLDTFHMNIEDASIPGAILQAGSKIQHFHSPDSNRAAAGTGHLDFQAILGALKTAGYQGYLMLEAFPQPDALTCARTHIEFLERVLAELEQDPAQPAMQL